MRGTASGRVNLRSGDAMRYSAAAAGVMPDRVQTVYPEHKRAARGASRGVHAGARTAARVERNRSRAMLVGRVYVLFLAVMSLTVVLMCVYYLHLKATITSQINANEKLESQLVQLRSENDALLEHVNNSLDLETVRQTAITEMGMNYAGEDQIVWYNGDDSSYIRQFGEVPSD